MALQLAAPAATKPSPLVDAAITIIIALLSGLVGARIYDWWTKVTEGGVLVTRGKSAIRGLKLLLGNISAIEQRITSFLADIDGHDSTNKLALRGNEELLDRCNFLEEAVVNAIEEWQDIIPEAANLSTQIGLISQLKGDRLLLHQQITEGKSQLAALNTVKEKSDEEKEQLLRSLKEKGEELKNVNAELRAQRSKLDATVLGGSSLSIRPTAITTGSFPTDIIQPFNKDTAFFMSAVPSIRRCQRCGNFVPAESTIKKCPQCGNDI